MHDSRISTGTDSLRPGKGGPPVRLSFLRPGHFEFGKRILRSASTFAITIGISSAPTAALFTGLSATHATAADNPLQAFLGLDYGRQIWMPALPVIAPDTLPPPRMSASLELDYLNLIRKTGSFAYDHGETVSAAHLSTAAIPEVEIHFTAERSDRDLDMGDTSTSANLGGETWEWMGSVAYHLTPWLTPTVTVGGDSRAQREHAVRALGLKGETGFGLAWSAELGDEHRDFPLTLHLKEYRPLILPLQMRQGYARASLEYRLGAWSAGWSGLWSRMRYADVPPNGYALGDSGRSWSQSGKVARDGIWNGAGWKASAEIQLGYGSHAFHGLSRRDQTQTRFSYQEAEQRSYSLRADLQSAHRGWDWGAYAGAAELEYDALRPDVAYDRHFWDRNGIIDSYQGSLLGVFDDETWLLNGAAYLSQAGGGLWAAKSLGGWRGEAGLGYGHLTLEANSHLTKRETTLILAYKEEDFDKTFPNVDADVLTPELRVTGSWGGMFLKASAAQALPVRVSIARTGGSGGGGSGTSDNEYSGGTRGRVEIGWRLP